MFVPAVTTHTVPGLPGVVFSRRRVPATPHQRAYYEWAYTDETYDWCDWGYYTKSGAMKQARKTRKILEAEARGEAQMLAPDPADLATTLPVQTKEYSA